MKAVLLDTKTGIKKTIHDPHLRSFEWAENNWSCDCNRREYFDLSDEEEDAMDLEAGGFCLGGKRFIVTDAEFIDPDDYQYTIRELNSDYPDELLNQYL